MLIGWIRGRRRLGPLLGSIHARMIAVSAVATIGALLVAGLAIGRVLEQVVIEDLDRRLDAELALLGAAVDADGRVDRAWLDGRLRAFNGGPGWHWRITGPHGTEGSADAALTDPPPPMPRWDALLEMLRRPVRPLDGVDKDGVRIHGRRLTITTRAGPVVLTAMAPPDVVRRPIVAALTPLLAILVAIATLLSAATLVQLQLGLRPLRRLRDQVAAIRTGNGERVDEDQPAELRPLAAELNALARDNAIALRTARQSAANLAHALKTPVATLALELRNEPARAAQIARIDDTIRHHLARARAEVTNRRASTALAPAFAGLVQAVRSLHAARVLTIDGVVGPDLAVGVDPHDLDEILGNLLDNAARHARSRVLIAARRDPADRRRILIEIADDGPGVPAAQRARVARPGTRLDERGDGHGFGLAIVVALVDLYGGTVELAESDLGGLLVRLTLPG